MDNNFNEFEGVQSIRRRDMLPWWIKTFCWIFMVAGVAATIIGVLSFFGIMLSLDIYGFDAAEGPLYLAISLSIYWFNGVTAFLLWTEHKEAVTVAKINAYFGILLCIISVIISFTTGNVMFRLEIILLGVFLSKLNKIEYDWYNAD